MTEPISIGTSTIPNLLLNRLNEELQYLQKVGYPLNVDIDRIGDITFMDCRVQDIDAGPREGFNVIRTYIANCLAQIIVDEWETRIIKKIVRNNFFYYNEEEKKIILQKAREILNPMGQDAYHQGQRKERVTLKILHYLEQHQELILEGFINFRLKDYQDELEEVVNSAVDDFLLEKEYMEFIRLLRYFVDIQEPRIEKVKIVFKNNGKFALFDSDNNPIRHECLEGLMIDLMDNEINYDDLLISALITLAPRQLELHLEEGINQSETLKTIHSVFGKRVSTCSGCEKCRP